MYSESKFSGMYDYFQTVGLRKESAFSTACIECGKCEKHCPQNIPIRQMIKSAGREVSPWYMKAAITVARKVLVRGKR